MNDTQTSNENLEKAEKDALINTKDSETPAELEINTISNDTSNSKKDEKSIAKEKGKERFEKITEKKSKEEEQLKNFAVSISNRTKGKQLAEPGNIGVRHTHCEVFIFLVDDNELQLKVLQEQFKNTRSFKKTKTFTNGKDLLEYIKNSKFPKNSIFLVVMDYFLEDSDDEEAQNGIAVLNELKAYDPNIEVIMLSSHGDVDIAASASYFGAVTFIQKGKDAFNKILNNIVWAIHEQEKIRKKADTKKVIKFALIGFISVIVILLAIDLITKGGLGLGIYTILNPVQTTPPPSIPIK